MPADLVDRLVRLVTWAPNHKRTWPWRCCVVTGEGRRRLGEAVAAYEAASGRPDRAAKARVKYLRAPVLVLAGAAHHGDDPVRRTENRDAVAAGVQNLLLGATAAGLTSHWATGTWMDDPGVKALAGLEPADELVALVYLGWPVGEVPAPERPEPVITRVDR